MSQEHPAPPAAPPDPPGAFLSTLPADRGQRRLALAVVVVSFAIFVATAPFAKLTLAPVWAFIPAYESALVILDLITAILLFGQFGFLRARALLVLASAYLFTASMAVSHALTFPGLFSPTGLLGAGPQSTAWLYMLWHGGFPLLVIGYARLKDETRATSRANRRVGRVVASSVAAILIVTGALTLLATVGQDLLPLIMRGNRYTPAMIVVVSSVWALSVVALVVLLRHRPHSVLDLWLMVVMCAWTFDIGLAAVLNHGRFDLGFYAGRAYGLLAATFVLVMLLVENGALYARLVEKETQLRRRSDDLQASNRELEAFSYSVSHDLRAPLRAMDGFSRILLEEQEGAGFSAKGRRYLGLVRENAVQMGHLVDDLLMFSRLGRQALRWAPILPAAIVRDVLDDLRPEQEDRRVEIEVAELPACTGDPALLRQVWLNLLSNALKYTRRRVDARIEVGSLVESGESVYFVRDNGVGFDMRYVGKLFGVFQRLHRAEDYEGTGVGLAIVQRIVHRHGGRVWAAAEEDKGATFYFTLGAPAAAGPAETP